MKKIWIASALLVVLLLVGGLWLYTALTAGPAPAFPTESADALPGQLVTAVFTGEEVAVSEAQLNGLLQMLPQKDRENLLGVELTGENTAAVWLAAELFGKSCPIRTEVSFTFLPETGDLRCTVSRVQVGRVPLPEKLVERVLEERSGGLDFSGKSIIININDLAQNALQLKAAGLKNLRCDADALYLTPVGAGALLGAFLGGNF